MKLLFIGTQETLIIVPLVYGVFILAIFYGLYKVLYILQNRNLTAKREYNPTLLLQTVALNEIATAMRESNDKSGTQPEVI